MRSTLAAMSWTPADLINHLWQSSVIALALLLLMALCAQLSARTRLTLSWMALAKFALPFGFFASFVALLGGDPERWLVERLFSAPVELQAIATASPAAKELPPRSETGAVPSSQESRSASAFRLAPIPWILTAVWLAGCAGLYGWWIIGGFRLRRRLLANSAELSPALAECLAAAAAKAGITELPRCLAVPDWHGPGLLGVFSPILTLPQGLEDKLSPAELEAVLLHELVHLRRRDPFWLAVHVAAVSALWFNPVAWLLSRWIRLETEKACDERVLELTGRPDIYALGILKVVHLALGLPEPRLLSVITPPVVSRVKNILRHESRPDRRWLRAAALASGAILLALGGGRGVTDAKAAILPARSAATAKVPVVSVVIPPSSTPYFQLILNQDIPTLESSQGPMGDTAESEDAAVDSEADCPTGRTAAASVETEPSAATGHSLVLPLTPSAASSDRSTAVESPGIELHPDAVGLTGTLSPMTGMESGGIRALPAATTGAETGAMSDPPPPQNRAPSGSSPAPAETHASPNSAASSVPEGGAASLRRGPSVPESTAGTEAVAVDFRPPAAEKTSGLPAFAAVFATATPSSFSAAEMAQVSPGVGSAQFLTGPGFDGRNLDLIPQPTLQIQAVYPAELRRRRVEGFANVGFTVDRNGFVQNPRVISSSEREFAQPALEAVSKWQFQPGRKGGRPVAINMSVVIKFHLTDSEKASPSKSPVAIFASAVAAPTASAGETGNLADLPKIYLLQELDVAPVATLQVGAIYPTNLKRLGVDGRVQVGFVVDEKGNVRNVRALDSSDDRFTEAALAAVGKWKFKPGKKDGRAVPAALDETIDFRLAGNRI